MRLQIVAVALAGWNLAGCGTTAISPAATSAAKAGYAGVGIYRPGEIWKQIARTSVPTDSTRAELADDDQVIVVVDNATGEVRQCGNMSGYCVGLNPWSRPVEQGAPIALLKHVRDLEAEATKAAAAQPATPR